MQVNNFPVTHSVLSVEALTELVAEQYDLPKITSCIFLALGLNDTFLVQTAADKYILRVYQLGWRTEDDVLFELEYLQYLDGQGIAVSTPLVKKDGTTLLKINAPEGLRYAALFTFAPGQDLKPEGLEAEQTANLYGQAVAKLHNASASFISPHPRFALDLNHILEEPLAKLLPLLADRPDDYQFIEQTSQQLRQLAAQVLTNDLERGLCHGDFHGGNASLAADGAITFYDFDCCGYGWRAYELAVFRWNADALMNGDLLWPAFLQGYQMHRPIAEADLAVIPLLEFIRNIWYLGLEAGRTRFVSHRRWNSLVTFEIANIKKLQEKYKLLA